MKNWSACTSSSAAAMPGTLGHTATAHRRSWATRALLTPLLTLLAASAHAQNEVVLGFDLYNDLATNISTQGVSFAGATVLACGGSLNCQQFPPYSGRNVIYDTTGTGGVITATFDKKVTGVVSAVSARITGNRAITMTAFDESGQAIGSQSTGGANYVGAGAGIAPNLKLTVNSTSSRPIARVTFHDTGNTFTIDDFSYVGRPTAFLLDPGHGKLLGSDNALHFQRPATPAFGLREDNLTLSMASAAKTQLLADGYSNVFLTREDERALYAKPCGTIAADGTIPRCNEDLILRIEYAKKLEIEDNNRTLFVSIHTNGGSNRLGRGRTQTFWCERRSESLAMKLQAGIEALAPPNLHLLPSVQMECSDLAVLAKTSEMKIPGALVEVLYHNNAEDEALLNDPANLTKYGKAIGTASRSYAEEN